jgi:phospholipid/cholesterol/gamma-HCH transport system substrate-binding protein
MSVRANPTVIGAFVVGATILFVAGLLFWGGTGMFRTRYRYVMYFDAAVTGLQKGAPVLRRGVRVGEVSDVQIRWGTSIVVVYIDLEPDVFKGVAPRDIGAAIETAIRERAVRGQLRMQSFVTGILYVALDDFPGTPVVLRGLDKNVPEVPTVPTDIEVWEKKLAKIGDAVEALPLQEIARSLMETMDEARRLLKSPALASALKNLDAALADVPGLIRKVDALASNVNAQIAPLSTDAQAALKSAQTVLTSAQVALAEVPALVQEVRKVVAKLDAHADPLLASLEKTSDTAGSTLERAKVTLAGVDGTLRQDSALGYELGKTLREVREAARALGALADYLERSPDALIYGRRPEPASR